VPLRISLLPLDRHGILASALKDHLVSDLWLGELLYERLLRLFS
jgi:hypothetical protein